MSNTKETHEKMWRRLSELFGRKWFDEYGSEAPISWRELFDKYTPTELKAGLERLRERKSEFVPTLPEVSQALDAARSRLAGAFSDPNELRRGFWRAVIIGSVARELGHTGETLEPVLIANKASLGQSMASLLDEVVDSEIRTGQRTAGHLTMVSERCRRIAVAFNDLKAAKGAP